MAEPWLEKRTDWLDGYIKEKPINKPKSNLSVITHIPIRCPKCHSKKVRCYGSRHHPILYYKCQEKTCGWKFKVLEEE